jgi:peroxiredoxin
LLDFQKNLAELREKDIRLFAASCDTLEKAKETIERYQLTFPLGYDLVASEIAALTGAFYDDRENYLHATGYILDPEGRVSNGTYSTRAVGRPTARDAIGWIEYWRKKQ